MVDHEYGHSVQDNQTNGKYSADGQPGKFSFVLRGYVRKWCSEIDDEFAKVKLIQDLISGGRSPQSAAQPA